MSTVFSEIEMASLVEAIQHAENSSTGEIRVHIDGTTEEKNAEVAFQVFTKLCMDKTTDRNAVLFHVNFEKKYLTIIGDEGIHKKVKQSFWDYLHDKTTKSFQAGNYLDGLKNAILETGEELKNYFPITGEKRNELSDEITFS